MRVKILDITGFINSYLKHESNSSREWELPDKSGVIALLDDISGGGSSNSEVLEYACSDEWSVLIPGVCITDRFPSALTITSVRASLTTAQASGSIVTIDVKVNGTSIFSTLLTIDNTEKTSVSASTPAVISSGVVSDDDEFTIEITQVDGVTDSTGLKVKFFVEV